MNREVDSNTLKLADALGWKQFMRLGIEVWYDPEGGHVLPHELKAALNDRIDALISEAPEPLSEDLVALEKLGNPFSSRPCRPCQGTGKLQESEYVTARCHHCAGRGKITPEDEKFIAMLNAPVIHPISGLDLATHARQP